MLAAGSVPAGAEARRHKISAMAPATLLNKLGFRRLRDQAGRVGALEKFSDRAFTLAADVFRILIDVQSDMPPHHIFAHFQGVLANVRHDLALVLLRVPQAIANRIIERADFIFKVTPCQDRAERYRQIGLGFPPSA